MPSPFKDYEVTRALRPSPADFDFDLARALSSVVALEAAVPADAFTADALGVERVGNGIVIGAEGLVLTIGYLVTEADEVTLTANDGRKIPAHVLGYDQVTGFGLVHALEPLDLPAMTLGDSRELAADDPVIVAGAGGLAHALAARIVAREPFAGYWEYLLDEGLFTAPAHPHWSGAALIGPQGELVGVGSLQLEQRMAGGKVRPLNMCVPAELIKPILDDLAHGRPAHTPRPWLGVFCHEADGAAVILDVAAGGPADRAELRRGDMVRAVDGQAVSDLAGFYSRLWEAGPAGAHVDLRVSRGGDEFGVQLRSIDRASLLKKRRFN